ncbi:hypothetical protein DFS34DRAFT_590342 [Phlyctochytrium arcticum]|nr:hypothetical protein DFS34DRAFT_590342 [Phlyctochytrium arcticum]
MATTTAGEAAEFLGSKGCQVDVTQFEDKYRLAIKELDQTGGGIQTNEAKMGVESIRDEVLKICPCFEDLDPIFMDRAVHKPLLTTDSSQGFDGLISTSVRRPSRRTDDSNDPESRDSEGPSTGAAMPAPRRRTGMAIQSIMNDNEGTRSSSTRRNAASLSLQRGPQRRSASPQEHPGNRSASPPAGRNAEVAPTGATGGNRWVATQPKKPTPGIPSSLTGHSRLGQPHL